MTRILNPTLHAAAARTYARAARPARLSGAPLGLLANGKTHGMTFLDRVADQLRARYDITEFVRFTKASPFAPAADADTERLAKRCTAILTAIGD
jgi:hypothetical protein